MQDYDTVKVRSENEGNIEVRCLSDSKDHRAKHGLYRSLIANMVHGVNEGFTKELELVGVGYRCQSKN